MDKKDVVYLHNEILFSHDKGGYSFETTLMDLACIMLSEISHTERDKYCMILLTCRILKVKPVKPTPPPTTTTTKRVKLMWCDVGVLERMVHKGFLRLLRCKNMFLFWFGFFKHSNQSLLITPGKLFLSKVRSLWLKLGRVKDRI